MNCPQCNEKANRGSGGVQTNAGRIRYYHCPDCAIHFSVTGSIVKILTDEPDLPFKSRREAFRTVRQAVSDDREWFESVTDETRALARLVVRNYLKDANSETVRRRGLRPEAPPELVEGIVEGMQYGRMTQ